MGLIVPKTKDGRVLFFLPWEGSTICGTTDSESEITMSPCPTQQEVDFIIEESNRYLAKKVQHKDVRAAWSGLRPLVRDLSKPAGDTASVSREHVVEALPEKSFVSIMGGKWTTYRKMAEDAVDAAIGMQPSLSSKAGPCVTSSMQLLGADRAGIVVQGIFDRITVTLREEYKLSKDIATHLTSNYGTRSLQVAEMMREHPEWRKKLAPQYPFTVAEVMFAVEQELACSALDVVARRLRIAFLDAEVCKAVTEQVVSLMGDRLKWSRSRRQDEVASVKAFLETMNQGVESPK
jgi:glycerol-3-phosphate dehydrogenase